MTSRTLGPRGVDGDRWLGRMATDATCGSGWGDQITCSALSCSWLLRYPSWTQATLPSWTGQAVLVFMVCWLLGRTECNYASELCGRRRQGRTIKGPGDKIYQRVVCKISQWRIISWISDMWSSYEYSITEMHAFVADFHCQYLFTMGNDEQRGPAPSNDNCQHTIYGP